MAGDNGETVDLEQLALEYLQGTTSDTTEEEYADEEGEHEAPKKASGHPAWKPILDAVPEEYHEALMPQLQEWDTGVSRKFQDIHDKYAAYEELEDYDPSDLKEAAEIYQQLVNDPAATWESIGRVFGLSPQETAQSASEAESGDFDDLELPPALMAKLAKVDKQEQMLEMIAADLQGRNVAEEEAEEDAALEEYLEELAEEYGAFDEDYIVTLLAAGIDGDEAIARYQELVGEANAEQVAEVESSDSRTSAPRIMSSSGGVPSGSGNPNLSKLSDQDTKGLVAEILRLAQQE